MPSLIKSDQVRMTTPTAHGVWNQIDLYSTSFLSIPIRPVGRHSLGLAELSLCLLTAVNAGPPSQYFFSSVLPAYSFTSSPLHIFTSSLHSPRPRLV